ncbi:hypothetical protein [Streptomyces avicenniae]|uniref:hypothetical protein n=1 Tax=Streptomyces avicenniae TaxID=500153 RepID=UPI00069C565C|nr:hypothetical protein [Streptomyces avicenniae]
MTATFEDRLLAELQREVHLAAAEDPAPVRRTRRLPVRLAACATAVAAVTGGVLLFPGGTAPAAYAIETENDGTVSLSFLDGIGMEISPEDFAEDLAAAGIDVTLNPAPPGTMCSWPEHDPADPGAEDPRRGLIDRPTVIPPWESREDYDARLPLVDFTFQLLPGDVAVIGANDLRETGVTLEFFDSDPGPCGPVVEPPRLFRIPPDNV